jgi:catechol 2,3-dioxygenase-like lactoylglutathione lyase family enzyme
VLPTPTFHHLHLNSVDCDAAIAFYTRQFGSTTRTTWNGEPALDCADGTLLLFRKVDSPPHTDPQRTAIWHFGWHVPDSRASLERYLHAHEVEIQPLYTSEEGGHVDISSDTWPGTKGVLGLTRDQIREARAARVEPTRRGGFSYMAGPDGALLEYSGNHPKERLNHVHMWQEHPLCAQLWYQRHLNAPAMPGRESATGMTENDCKVPRGADRTWPSLTREGMYRSPRAAVMFSDVALMWYPKQDERTLESTRGHLIDHIGLGVTDLDAWVSKLRGEDVPVLEGPYALGDTRGVMIQGPSREALELVELR